MIFFKDIYQKKVKSKIVAKRPHLVTENRLRNIKKMNER